jgi:adenosylcobinamide-phosphate synthase
MDLSTTLPIALVALLLERFIGYPRHLLQQIGHPVEWMGRLIESLDRMLNSGGSVRWLARLKGILALLAVIVSVAAVTIPLAVICRSFQGGWVIEAILGVPFLAQVDLRRYVGAVAEGLDISLEQGRAAVSHIVGRDPSVLDEASVARAAIESLAENTSDAIVAPLFWLALFGLPGIAVYKAINTADSMIGHLNEHYRHFGWCAARLDDLVNLPCSRLTAFLIAAAVSLTSPSRGAGAFEVMMKDAKLHFSPNAGWPEAAMAGAMEVKLGGPRYYQGVKVDLSWIGRGRELLTADDIREGLKLHARTLNLLTVLVAIGVLFIPLA